MIEAGILKKTYCVICGKEKKGLDVDEDEKIKLVRWIKRNILKNAKNNGLVVCKECYPKYVEMRDKYQKRQATYIGLALLFGIVALIVSPRLTTIISIVLLAVFLYILDLMNYMTFRAVKLKAKGAQ